MIDPGFLWNPSIFGELNPTLVVQAHYAGRVREAIRAGPVSGPLVTISPRSEQQFPLTPDRTGID